MFHSTARILFPFLLWATCAQAQRNLITNGDAETGKAISSRDQSAITDVPGWTLTGSLTAAQYTNGDGFVGPTDYGPADRGSNYFIGGPAGGKATAAQSIDLSASAADIDLGKVKFYLSGYLGMAGTPSTPYSLKAVFKDAKGQALVTATITGPPGDDMGYPTALLARGTSGFLLPNTRSVDLLLDLSGPAGNFNAYGADNLSLILTTEPVIGSNLVVNGDAETAPGRDGKVGLQLPVPGWNGSAYVESYAYTEFSFSDDSLPAAHGKNVLSTAASNSARTAQLIDVTLAKDLIDGGTVQYNLSASLGGVDTDQSTASVTAEFLDAAGKALLTKTLGPIGQKERSGKTGFLSPTASGATPTGTRQIRVTLEFANLGINGYQVFADNIALTLSTAAATLAIKDGGIVHAATGQTGPLAPGEMVAIYTTGVNVSAMARMQLDSNGIVVNELAGVKVFFDGTQAPLLYVSSSQIGAIVPFDTATKSTVQVRVEYQGVKSNVVPMSIVKTSPGIFTQDTTGKGAGQIYNDTFLLNSTANPAAKGSVITIIWSGGGQTDPAGVDGRMETQSLPKPAAGVTVKVGGLAAEVVYVGAVPYSWAGLLQAQVKVPAATATGNAIPVVLTAGGANSPDGVTIAVK